ncbi:hypothetical protein Mapa_009388 [Marchantia paleacea]|nr:hypothetical protein Mapa_009388 [Marchantia paleacea]
MIQNEEHLHDNVQRNYSTCFHQNDTFSNVLPSGSRLYVGHPGPELKLACLLPAFRPLESRCWEPLVNHHIPD